ncbi:hypothetical protein [Kutzneria buriramensis]|uniref:Uncharacterized protein n=1 Tax=Kutzneria buriramensis TaxID=1045776 RepID=A0A3E0HZ09_9PSEU|nr:hypothetical protein [Kutzneria buriramensis]REH51718.1 hypothetical protein BCF44_103167 [Kutzneria buriramensis]
MSDRLLRRIQRDFPAPAEALRLIDELPADHGQDVERVQAAVVLYARGDISRLRDRLDLARIDWRDVLVSGDLADGDWPQRLDRELGPA